MLYKKTFLIISCALFIFGLANSVDAAKLYFIAEGESFGVGDKFYVDVKVDTEGVDINAAEAKVSFQNSVLELLSVEKDTSIFNFWLEGPNILNENGKMAFIGGTSKGVSGSALQIARLNFKAKGAGATEITAADAVVTASDGKGTNVLSTIEGISIGVGIETISPKTAGIPSPGVSKPAQAPPPVEQPKPVVREPVSAKNLPDEPKLTVPLYPDSSRWYNHLGEMIVFWEVPDDVIKVATQIDQDPNGKPQNIEEALFTGKKFNMLKEGVWYVHVQFKNNVGWGKIAHYKISIDTTPPLPFEVEIDNEVSDNPIPAIAYETHDSLSGVAEYLIFIDGKGPASTTSGTMVLSPQTPGQHTIIVRALDFAGNGTKDDLDFEILPLPLPFISFLTKSIAQGELVFASGKATPNGFVDIRLSNKSGQEVFLGEVSSDELGNWEISIEESLARGIYSLTATARDNRGAISYPTEAEELKVKAKTIVSIGFVDLGWFEIFLIIFLLVVSGTSLGAWYYTSLKRRRAAYKTIAGRDIDKLTTLLAEDLKELENWVEKSQEGFEMRAKPEMEFHLKNMRDTVNKMRNYLRQELDKLQ